MLEKSYRMCFFHVLDFLELFHSSTVKTESMRTIAIALILAAVSACQPIAGGDPLDSVGSNSPMILATPGAPTSSYTRTEIGLDTTMEF